MSNEQHDNSGSLSRNPDKDAEHPKWPDYRGSIRIDGRDYWLSGWVKDGSRGKFLSLAVKVKDAPPQSEPTPEPLDDDNMPF